MKKTNLLALCALLLAISLAGCVNGGEKDRQAAFINAVKTGVLAMDEQSHADYSDSAELRESLLKGVQAETDAIKNVDMEAFDDEDFKLLASEYADAVEEEARGLESFPGDAEAYNSSYVVGRAKVASVVSELVDKHGLKFDDPQILDNVKRPVSSMLSAGEKKTVKTDDGDIQIAVEGFMVDQESTERARQYDGFTSSQNYGYLLCTLTNESVDPKQSSLDNWLNIGSMVTIRGSDGVDLVSPNFSYDYPGYEIATGGYYAIPTVGSTKRIAIPYVVGTDEGELEVAVGDAFLFISPM